MEIKASDVKALREKTGAGMMDCKNALAKTSGDFDKAERLLKEQGLAAALKKSERATNSGKIFSKITADKGILLELTCETDFVARNDMFNALGKSLVEMAAAKNLTKKTDEMDLMVKEVVGKITENMELRRIASLTVGSGQAMADYIHDDKIGVLVRAKVSDPKLAADPKVKQTLFELALHVAAFAPMYLSKDKVDAAFVKDQEAIFAKQVESMDKPDNVKMGIVKGKVSKMLTDICLLEQPFVKDEKRKVSKVLEDLGKEVGGKVEVTDYIYMKLGEVKD